MIHSDLLIDNICLNSSNYDKNNLFIELVVRERVCGWIGEVGQVGQPEINGLLHR